MNADDKIVKRGPGRPPKMEPVKAKLEIESIEQVPDAPTPHHNAQVRQAKEAEIKKKRDVIVEKNYEMRDGKLILVKRKASGNVYRVFVGKRKPGADNTEFDRFVKMLKDEGRLEIV